MGERLGGPELDRFLTDPSRDDAHSLLVSLRKVDHDLIRKLCDKGWLVLVPPNRESAEALVRPEWAPDGEKGSDTNEGSQIRVGSLLIDMGAHQAHWREGRLNLTEQELLLLWVLAARPNQALPFAELTHAVWQSPESMYGDALRSAIKRLRRKLRDCEATILIEAVRGFGFRLTVFAPCAPPLSRQRDGGSDPKVVNAPTENGSGLRIDRSTSAHYGLDRADHSVGPQSPSGC